MIHMKEVRSCHEEERMEGRKGGKEKEGKQEEQRAG
jgi:hypothetical protein